MSAVFALPTPLSSEQSSLLAQFAAGTDNAGLLWASGYLAGIARAPVAAEPAQVPIATTRRATVIFGSQTGNAKRAAESLLAKLESCGLPARLLRADAYPLRELKDERLLYVVVSTQGEGDPPDDARGFVEFLLGKRAPALKQLKFAVLGLGDSSYPQFNATGRQLDERLAELGGQRLYARGEADLDLETVTDPWLASALDAAKQELKPATISATITALRPNVAATSWSREKPHAAELLANQRLTGRGSRKDVRHIELSLEGAGLAYQPGDALGVWPRNSPSLVHSVLAQLKLDGEAAVDGASLREWLTDKRELTRLARPFLQRHAERSGSDALTQLLAPGGMAALAQLLATHQVIDVLQAYPAMWSAADLVAALRPLAPRLYSIASSQSVVGAEAHLTVDLLAWDAPGGRRWGAASHLLASSAEGERLPVFIEANQRFRLPADGSRDIVMIGPGTGVAPFRGFVQERTASGASGRNWLLFGNPHARHDFLYQLEWQQALASGQLHRLDLAFSRDQAEKVYVQDKLRANGRELFAWLDGGAHLYICGDASRMARDVEQALLDVIAEHGGRDANGARDYLSTLQQQHRYARDVY